MYQPLVPCPGCKRHVRTTEAACPFCSEALSSEALTRAVVPGATVRLTRAAAFVFGATLAITAVDCGGDTENQTGSADDGASSGNGGTGNKGQGGNGGEGGVDDGGGNQALYGDPGPRDAGADGPDDDGGNMAEYGAPTIDGGDDGGAQPLYGAAPPT